jgi:four helix bundle protein
MSFDEAEPQEIEDGILNMGMRFEDLDAWKETRLLVRDIYSMCRDEMLGRDWGLRDQLQRASVSVMTNVAEGFERTGTQEKIHFYNIARASAGEVRSLLYIVEDNFSHLSESASDLRNFTIGAGKLISGLMTSAHRRTVAKVKSVAVLILLPISYFLSAIF